VITTPQKIKRTRQAHGGGQQAGLLRRCRNLHCGHHNIQDTHQQHALHRRCGHDDDEHKNYYLFTPLPRYEYMRMVLSRFPEEIIDNYNLKALAVDGWFYI
jgi:hypothetical protein